MVDITGITEEAASVYRDKESPGSSVDHEPIKSEIRALFGTVGTVITASLEAGSDAFILKQTEAELNADLAHDAGVWARVLADTQSPPQNGYYLKVGASGSGSWSFVTEDPAEAAALSAEASATAAEAAALTATESTADGITALGRAGRYGLDELYPASVFVTDGTDMGFADGYYRSDLVVGDDPTDVTGWAFSRAAAAYAATDAGLLVSFATGVPKITDAGLTIEPARTNLFLRSNTFSNASWSKNHCAITAAATTGPDGATSASLFAATGTGVPALYQSVTMTAADHTFTVYAKANGAQDWLVVNFQAKGFDNTTWFDLVNGVVGQRTGDSVATIEPAANGFYRCRITRPATAGSRQIVMGFSATEGSWTSQTAGQGIYLAFSQVELGSGPTYPIVTEGTTLARPADVATYAFTPAAEGFIYVEFIAPRVQNVFTTTPVSANVGSPVGIVNGEMVTSNGAVALFSGVSATEDELVRAVLTWDAGGRRFYANGGGSSDANGVGAITTLSLGNTDGALNSQIISMVAVNDVALTADECILLTGGSVTPGDFGVTTFDADSTVTKVIIAEFDGVEKAFIGQQGDSDYRPGAGVVAVHSPDGDRAELSMYQYGAMLRVIGTGILECFIGADPGEGCDLSVRHAGSGTGAKIHARDGTDNYSAMLAANGSTRVCIGASGLSPAEVLFQNSHASGYFAFRIDVEEDGSGGTELGRISTDGLRLPQRASAPTVASGYGTLWFKTDGTLQRTSNVGGVTTTVEIG